MVTKRIYLWLWWLLLLPWASAQIQQGGGGGGLTQVTSLPATCTTTGTAPVYLKSGTTGIYVCVATNTWKLVVTPDSSGNVAISTVVLGPYTVSTLPAASSSSGKITIVTDGTSGGDCTTGSGSSAALCRSNGTSWIALGGAGSVTVNGTTCTIGGSCTVTDSTKAPTASPTFTGLATFGSTLIDATTWGLTIPTAVQATAGPVSATVSGFYYNNYTSTMTYNLPTITSGGVGARFCFFNYAGRTGAITLQAPASTYIDNNGANGSQAGTLVSSGALGDAVCVHAVAVGQYKAFIGGGSWTNN
jgi:hypothetical protein